MTARMRLRRWARMQGKRRAAAHMSRRSKPQSGRRAEQPPAASQRRFMRVIVCGALFVSLVLLKLVVPGNLAAFRGTLAQWLVRDADFREAFSAVGHAVAAPQHFAESLGNAYIAVFGDGDAREVGGKAEFSQPSDTDPQPDARPLPDYVNSGAESFHTGLDLAADEGTPFVCFADGTVGVVGESTVLGKYLTVRHAEGYETLYAHCSKISVGTGQSVLRGDTLGAVGATGNATGAHLHFELLQGSKYLDPTPYAAKTV